MSAITAADFYKAHQDQEHEYVFVEPAYAVKAGETITVNNGIRVMTAAEKDGYLLGHSEAFITAADLESQTVPADSFERPVPREDITPEELADITPVKKGDNIFVNAGIPIHTAAEHDGVLIKTSSGTGFMSAFKLTEAFNYVRAPDWTEECRIVMHKDDKPIRGILLDEEVTFAFKAGDYTAEAGSVLYVNPDDEDGYTVQYTPVSPNTMLRISPAETASKSCTVAADKDQDELHAAAPRKMRFKL